MSDFILTLPVTFNLLKLIALIADPMFVGNAPDLSAPGGEYYSVYFHHGEGRGGLLDDRYAAAGIADRVRLNLEIIAAVDDLEQNLKDITRFVVVKERLIAFNPAQRLRALFGWSSALKNLIRLLKLMPGNLRSGPVYKVSYDNYKSVT